jgi:HAD superfamily hydrolase (TIGR01509 family)
MAPAASIEAVVFDWDGTLMDSKRALLSSYHEATTAVLGAPFPVDPADVEKIIQLRAAESFSLIAKGDPELAERVATAFQDAYRRNQETTEPFPGTLETLAELRARGIRLGVATSKAQIRMDLEGERTGISKLIEESVTGDQVKRAKPDPESVIESIRRLGVEPARTLYVGDGPNDIRAARGAGAIAVGVSYGFHPEQLRAEGPDHVIDHPGELLELVSR